jgi:hypothetical protein
MDKDLIVTQKELDQLDSIARDVTRYSEDDRRKADSLYQYYQELIDKGDAKGETRESLAKSLELRESSVHNLIEILKLKTKLIEKKIQLEMKNTSNDNSNNKGSDTSELIASIEKSEE